MEKEAVRVTTMRMSRKFLEIVKEDVEVMSDEELEYLIRFLARMVGRRLGVILPHARAEATRDSSD